jgi:hypothetical protein
VTEGAEKEEEKEEEEEDEEEDEEEGVSKDDLMIIFLVLIGLGSTSELIILIFLVGGS